MISKTNKKSNHLGVAVFVDALIESLHTSVCAICNRLDYRGAVGDDGRDRLAGCVGDSIDCVCVQLNSIIQVARVAIVDYVDVEKRRIDAECAHVACCASPKLARLLYDRRRNDCERVSRIIPNLAIVCLRVFGPRITNVFCRVYSG